MSELKLLKENNDNLENIFDDDEKLENYLSKQKKKAKETEEAFNKLQLKHNELSNKYDKLLKSFELNNCELKKYAERNLQIENELEKIKKKNEKMQTIIGENAEYIKNNDPGELLKKFTLEKKKLFKRIRELDSNNIELRTKNQELKSILVNKNLSRLKEAISNKKAKISKTKDRYKKELSKSKLELNALISGLNEYEKKLKDME